MIEFARESAEKKRSTTAEAAAVAGLVGAATATKPGVRLAISATVKRTLRRTLRLRRKQELAARLSRMVQFDLQAEVRGWDLRDARGRSARVYAPGSRRRIRREKTEWEKVSTIRSVRNALAVAALAGAGTAGYLAHSNLQLRRKLQRKHKPKPPPATIIKPEFRKTS